MKKINRVIYYFFFASLIPQFAFAFTLVGSNLGDVIREVKSVVDTLIPILTAVAFIVFFWGLTKFILHSDSSAEIQKGKNYMVWGAIALFVLSSYLVIAGMVGRDFGLGTDTNVLPSFPTNVTSAP